MRTFRAASIGFLTAFLASSPLFFGQSGKEGGNETKKKVYTNEDLKAMSRDAKEPSVHLKTDSRTSEEKNVKDSAKWGDLENYRDSQGHGREYWQKRSQTLQGKMDEVNQKIAGLEERRKKVGGTQGIRVSRSGKLVGSNDLQRIDQQLETLRREKTQLERQKTDLEDEARKQGALPEWLR